MTMAAPLEISVKLDKRALDAAERMLRGIPHGLRRVAPPAINRTVTRTRTFVDGILAKELPVKKSAIRRRTRIFKASRHRWQGGLRYSDHRFAISSFKGARQTKKGVTYNSGQGRKLIPRAFMTAGFRHYATGERIESKTVWRRARVRGTGVGEQLVGRTPLTVPKGASLGYIWTRHPEIRTAAERFGRRRLVAEIHHQTRRMLRRYA